MTNEEAIEYIKLIKTCDAKPINEALKMAIEALKQTQRIPRIKVHSVWADEKEVPRSCEYFDGFSEGFNAGYDACKRDIINKLRRKNNQ